MNHPLSATTVDLERSARCGFPEVIFAEGKSPETIVAIARKLLERRERVLATRVAPDQAEKAIAALPTLRHNPTARTLRADPEDHADLQANSPSPIRGRVAVISAGTTDLPVAEEARETLAWMSVEAAMIHDVGVAGPHRLTQRLSEFQDADAVVVVAGMEGALPSVVGGHVACPVFAVPTSVGYGANFGGLAALLSMLNSCASNVAVVNIDAGFKAGYLAGLVATRTVGNGPGQPDSGCGNLAGRQ